MKVITIDGPAASGKTSVSREVARKLSWPWVSTGSFYRGLAYVADKEGVTKENPSGLVELAKSDLWEVRLMTEKTEVYYRGQNVTNEVQQEEVGNLASQISSIPEVREALLQAQRDCAGENGLVAEGRDCGSVVFPQAPFKFYLTARSDSRAQRRASEQGRSVEETKAEQKQRDKQDSERKTAPMQVPEGAEVIDTSDLGLDDVVAVVYKAVESAF